MVKIDLFEISKAFNRNMQIKKIREEINELEIAYLGNKCNRDKMEHVIEEAFDVMQAAFTFIRLNVKDVKEIEEANILHIEKMKRRYSNES